MGRVTKEQAAKNRQRVVEGAAQLFQRHGLKGIAIADLMAEAGLTHGGFYRQFASKDDVAGEACAHSMRRAASSWQTIAGREPPEERLRVIADAYLTASAATHRCPMPTLAADVAREAPGSPVRKAFTDGVAALAETLTCCVPEGESAPARRERALGLLAAMVGAVAISRAIDDEALSNEIASAVRHLAAGT
jgi:TetR/AcrR family transcriptional repressor of nem operon